MTNRYRLNSEKEKEKEKKIIEKLEDEGKLKDEEESLDGGSEYEKEDPRQGN